MSKLSKSHRAQLIEKLISNMENSFEQNPSLARDFFLEGFNHKGYNNFTDEELLREYSETFDELFEHDPLNKD